MSDAAAPARDDATIHATAVAIGESGVLIRGPSGTGKSRLALMLIAAAARQGHFARLVGDDRVRLTTADGRVIARAPDAIAGFIEERGTGILACDHEAAVRLACIVDLAPAGVAAGPARLPDPADSRCKLGDVWLPCLSLAASVAPEEGARRVFAFLCRIGTMSV
jgi:hypothetical protein